MTIPASCRLQIDAVYEPHYQHFADKFGTVIAGFFSDEPELGNNRMYKMNNPLGTEQDLPWSRELAAALEEKLGRGYGALLPLLWSNDGDPFLTAKVRYAFMDSVSRLVEEDFSHQIGRWCRDHGVEYIGHVVEDNNQHARTGTSLGHYFRGLKWQTMAGIDDIGGQVEPGMEDRQKKNVFGYHDDGEFYHYALGKLGASLGALNPNMQGRTMCEIFGNYGWKEGVRLEKYLLDHFMVRGVNRFVPHAFTAKAFPDKDCPPHFYAHGHNPQYRHFGALMQYADRVTGMLSGGHAVCPVAILYHGEAEWCGKAMLMQKPGRILQDNQIDFHYVPADVFGERDFYRTEITDKLTVNGLNHEALVIPYTPPALTRRRVLEGFRLSVCKAADYPRFGPAREIGKPENYALIDKKFSGLIRYETHFTGKAQLLEITDAWEGVEVFINGKSAGIQVTPPYRYDLRGLAGEGDNALTIEVATTLERDRGNTKTAAPTGITGEVALYE